MTSRSFKGLSFLLGLCLLYLFLMEINANSEPVQWKVNGHWYDAIDGEFTWFRAFLDARSRSHQELPGHLATLTSQEENDFVWETFQAPDHWLGGFQIRWARELNRGWRWITREQWNFTNWTPNTEPNDCCETVGVEDGEENFLQFAAGNSWNDNALDGFERGYIIEYEQMPKQALAPIIPKDIHQLTTTWANLKESH